jgi:hypothetical protein
MKNLLVNLKAVQTGSYKAEVGAAAGAKTNSFGSRTNSFGSTTLANWLHHLIGARDSVAPFVKC